MTEKVFGQGWTSIFEEEYSKPYFKKLQETIVEEYKKYVVRPAPAQILNAFMLTQLEDVKVVLMAQDPYPSQHAHGLAFSTTQEAIPASLRTIFKEIKSTYPETKFTKGELTPWAKQGVLLINTVLTVRDKASNSHKDLGWEEFTGAAIRALAQRAEPLVFCLWGKSSQNNFRAATHQVEVNPAHLILEAGHPATASYGKDSYSGNGHFKKIEEFLKVHGKQQIEWSL